MRKVKVITDSTADLSKEMLKSLDVASLPLKVNFSDETFLDGIDINTEDLYRLVSEKGELPKTSAIAPGEFILEFQKWLDQDYDIVYVGIGSTISGTFQAAHIASQEFEEGRVNLVDSKNLSSGIALLVLKAHDFVKAGFSAQEIKQKLDELVPKVRSQFAIQVLDYLHKGGRASGTAALVGKFLRIRPIIKVNDGKLEVYKKPMGTMTKAVDIMLTDFMEQVEKNNVDLDYVMITHSLNDKQSEYMQDYVRKQVNVKNLIESYAGCVISSHCGKGTIGILYILKDV